MPPAKTSASKASKDESQFPTPSTSNAFSITPVSHSQAALAGSSVHQEKLQKTPTLQLNAMINQLNKKENNHFARIVRNHILT